MDRERFFLDLGLLDCLLIGDLERRLRDRDRLLLSRDLDLVFLPLDLDFDLVLLPLERDLVLRPRDLLSLLLLIGLGLLLRLLVRFLLLDGGAEDGNKLL